MQMSFAHPVILWLALFGQAVGMGLPGGGGFLCSEADGQIKIEFTLLECCGPIIGSDFASYTDEEDSCSNTGCTDRLIDEVQPLTGRVRCVVDTALGRKAPRVVPLLCDHGPHDASWLEGITALKALRDTSSPHEPMLVRAVVFLL